MLRGFQHADSKGGGDFSCLSTLQVAYFGERALLQKEPRAATIKVLSEAEGVTSFLHYDKRYVEEVSTLQNKMEGEAFPLHAH